MKTVCWILKDQAPETLTQSIDGLGAFGIVSTVLQVSELGQVPTEIPTGVEALVFYASDPKWLKEALAHLRVDASLQLIPMLAVCESADSARREGILAAGIDDFLSLGSESDEWVSRLRLRGSQAEVSRAQAAKIAKSEITLKQREEFLSVCAHDLRSPLGLIQSSLSMVLASKEAVLGPLQSELLARAKRQAGHAITLVNDLLDVMALEQGLKPQYQLLDLHRLLTEFYEDYKIPAEQKEIQFHYVNPISGWRVLADADRIRQLLQNLFTNALKFTERGKNIYLTVLPFQGKRKTDPIYPMIVISLKDEGKGIPASEAQKIFDRFSQLKDAARSEGRGLGLTVSKQISNLHDGNLWVQSEEGHGSTFYVLLPHVISRVSVEERPVGERPRLVVAEPSAARRESLFKAWEEKFDIVYARDGVEALTLLFHWMPAAVILAPNLTKLDEVEAANIAKSDPLTTSIPLFLALDESQRPSKKHENMVCDRILNLPLSAADLERELVKPVAKSAA